MHLPPRQRARAARFDSFSESIVASRLRLNVKFHNSFRCIQNANEREAREQAIGRQRRAEKRRRRVQRGRAIVSELSEACCSAVCAEPGCVVVAEAGAERERERERSLF